MILSISSDSYLAKKYANFSNEKIIHTHHKNKKNTNSVYFKLGISKIEKIIKKKIDHCIIFISIKNSENNNKKKFDKFTSDIKELIKKLIKYKIPFIFFSTESVYENQNKDFFKENYKIKPYSLYAVHKFKIEKFILKNAKYFTILRLGRAYDDVKNKNNFLSNIINQIIKNKKKKISFAHDFYFSPINIRDLNAIIQIIIKRKIYGVFNLSGDQKVSYFEIAKKINKLLKTQDKVILKKESIKKFSKYTLIGSIAMDNSKIKKKINYKFLKIENIIRQFIKKEINSKI